MASEEIDYNSNIMLDGRGNSLFPPGSYLKCDSINGKKEGDCIVYSSNRIMIANLHFYNDLLDGLCIFNNDKGVKIRECVYERGKKNGWYREFENGQVIFTGIYRNDEEYSELREYDGNNEYLEEVKDGNTIGFWKFLGDKHMEGIYYCFENNCITHVYKYNCGETNRIMIEFDGDQMIEYDDEERIVYVGEYDGDFISGYRRMRRGSIYIYEDEIVKHHLWDMNNEKALFHDTGMQPDDTVFLKYEGGWCMKDNMIVYNGEGIIYSSPEVFYKALFENGKEIRKIMTVNKQEMIEYDEQERMVYKGGYDKVSWEKKGQGFSYHYDNGKLNSISICENGNTCYQYIQIIDDNKMKEYDENGNIIYEGEYDHNDYSRHGKGIEYMDNDIPVYNGEWKNGKREGDGYYYKNRKPIFHGYWRDNQPNGQGIYDDEINNRKFGGEWKNGLLCIYNLLFFDYSTGTVINSDYCIVNIYNSDQLQNVMTEESLKDMINEIVIEEGCGNELETNVMICGYKNLKKIVIKKNCMKNLNSLTISNNSILESIEIEDGNSEKNNNDSKSIGACYKVKNVEISSIFYLKIAYNLDLPDLKTFITGKYAFHETDSLTLSSIFYSLMI